MKELFKTFKEKLKMRNLHIPFEESDDYIGIKDCTFQAQVCGNILHIFNYKSDVDFPNITFENCEVHILGSSIFVIKK